MVTFKEKRRTKRAVRKTRYSNLDEVLNTAESVSLLGDVKTTERFAREVMARLQYYPWSEASTHDLLLRTASVAFAQADFERVYQESAANILRVKMDGHNAHDILTKLAKDFPAMVKRFINSESAQDHLLAFPQTLEAHSLRNLHLLRSAGAKKSDPLSISWAIKISGGYANHQTRRWADAELRDMVHRMGWSSASAHTHNLVLDPDRYSSYLAIAFPAAIGWLAALNPSNLDTHVVLLDNLRDLENQTYRDAVIEWSTQNLDELDWTELETITAILDAAVPIGGDFLEVAKGYAYPHLKDVELKIAANHLELLEAVLETQDSRLVSMAVDASAEQLDAVDWLDEASVEDIAKAALVSNNEDYVKQVGDRVAMFWAPEDLKNTFANNSEVANLLEGWIASVSTITEEVFNSERARIFGGKPDLDKAREVRVRDKIEAAGAGMTDTEQLRLIANLKALDLNRLKNRVDQRTLNV